jgi:hypothetical protein
MEDPTPFDLSEAIRHWQKTLEASPAFNADNLEELASHLRASVEKLTHNGYAEEEAFQMAVLRIGAPRPLAQEFRKVNEPPTWSLPVSSFWVVAVLYLLQAAYSLTYVFLCLRELFEGRSFQRFMAGNPSVQQMYVYLNLQDRYHWQLFAPITSTVVGLLFILAARLATGSWKNVGRFIRSFERPIRTTLGLVTFGLLITVLPAFLPGMFSAIPAVRTRVWVPPDGMTGRATISVVLVLAMVLLARRGLRKMPPTHRGH